MSVKTSSLRATDIGEFIRYKSCERRFKLGYNNRELAKQLPFAGRLFASLDPILQAQGKKREQEWENYLRKQDFADLSNYEQRPEKIKSTSWDEFANLVRTLKPGKNAYVRELAVAAEIASFRVEGRIDFALVIWRGAKPKLRLVECKASRKDQTYHRAQLAIYKLIIEKLTAGESPLQLAASTIKAQDIECVVARIDEETNRSQALLEIPAFDLSMIEQDVLRLLADAGPLADILERPLESLSYQLESKCDDCVFNVHCLPESGRERKLQLLACDPSTVRALEAGGITNLDELAEVDLCSPMAEKISKSSSFAGSLQFLKSKASARLSSLPNPPSDAFQVKFLSYRVFSQLPEHDLMGQRLIRIYLCVDYDYTENRLASLSAHVTASDGLLHTGWLKENDKNVPDPEPKERVPIEGAERQFEERALRGVDISFTRDEQWTGVYEWDTAAERKLLEDFFQALVAAIKEVAEKRAHAPIHFYVWSRNEITRLVEACSRSGSHLLGHLQELLGCRESLEQLIYSVLQDEVNNRFGLAWTGRGLLVASTLNWYGWTYHWHRKISGVATWLDRVFNQDLFDFKADLFYDNGSWLNEGNPESPKHKFEIRTQFNDNLPAGYLHAFWGTLPEGESSKKSNAKKAIENYRHAEEPEFLKEYLRARAHALRWVEERIDKKSSALQKPPIFIKELPEFSLKVNHPSRASIDFLRLDFHIKFTDWLAQHLLSPMERISSGRTIPVRNVKAQTGRLIADIDLAGFGIGIEELQARSSFEIGSFVRLSPCEDDPGISQTLGQFGRAGITCIIKALDWENKRVEMSSIPLKDADKYRLSSRRIDPDSSSLIFANATIDENPSDFISPRVEQRLEGKFGKHAFLWFDRTSPQIPQAKQLSDFQILDYKKLCKKFKPDAVNSLATDQMNAILTGLQSTVQLIQGPPGTGKTMTTAAAILLRILAAKDKQMTVLVSAHTHTAIETLLARIAGIEAEFRKDAAELDLTLPPLSILKVGSSHIQSASVGATVGATPCVAQNLPKKGAFKVLKNDDRTWPNILTERRNGIAIIGATVGALLRLAKDAPELHADLLVIDEASMMVFPHFLALATIVRESGRFLLAGDHRQLAPILAHDWEREDRPPSVLYQPYSSAYNAIRDLSAVTEPEQICMSALTITYRLPDEIRRLIAKLYRLDAVELAGIRATHSELRQGPIAEHASDGCRTERVAPTTIENNEAKGFEPGSTLHPLPFARSAPDGSPPVLTGGSPAPKNNEVIREKQGTNDSFKEIFASDTGLYLISHNERESRQSNLLEAEIIEKILESAPDLPDHSVAIVTPHRAQRTLLQTRLKNLESSRRAASEHRWGPIGSEASEGQRAERAPGEGSSGPLRGSPVDLIDTVERLQGGERPNIIFSATVSDPAAIASSVEFILDLNRSNVAFSRAKQRLIVICSEALINYVPAALDQYEETLLWKSLREICSQEIATLDLDGHKVRVYCPVRPGSAGFQPASKSMTVQE